MQKVRDCNECNWFSTLPQKFLWQALLASFVASIEAVPAFSIPYGNDVQIPSVFGKGCLYISSEGYFYILFFLWWYGAQGFADVRESAVE